MTFSYNELLYDIDDRSDEGVDLHYCPALIAVKDYQKRMTCDGTVFMWHLKTEGGQINQAIPWQWKIHGKFRMN